MISVDRAGLQQLPMQLSGLITPSHVTKRSADKTTSIGVKRMIYSLYNYGIEIMSLGRKFVFSYIERETWNILREDMAS